MHLGMSGSFRVGKDGEEAIPGEFQYERSKAAAHDHVVFHMSSGATVTFNDPRRFGFMKLVPRAQLDQEPLLRSIGPEPLGNEFGAALCWRAPAAARRRALKAALSDQRVVAGLGQYLCLRSAAPRAIVAEAARFDHRRRKTASRTNARSRSPMRSRRCSTTRSRRAAHRCAIIAAPTASSAISSIRSGCMTAKARNVRRAAARARSGGSCRPAARRFSVRSARSKPLSALISFAVALVGRQL